MVWPADPHRRAANYTVVISFELSNVKNHILIVYTSHKNARIGDGGSYCFTSITRIGWRNQVITDPRSTKVSYMCVFCLPICANFNKGCQILGSREAWNVRVGRKGPFQWVSHHWRLPTNFNWILQKLWITYPDFLVPSRILIGSI